MAIEHDCLIPDEEPHFAVTADRIVGNNTVVARPVFGIGVKVEKHVIGKVFDIDIIKSLCIGSESGYIGVQKGIPI